MTASAVLVPVALALLAGLATPPPRRPHSGPSWAYGRVRAYFHAAHRARRSQGRTADPH